jgi:hypothetical protein
MSYTVIKIGNYHRVIIPINGGGGGGWGAMYLKMVKEGGIGKGEIINFLFST